MHVLQTDRLNLRWLEPADADFILRLTNEPSWLQYIGDKGIRSLEDAEKYILNGPRAMYHDLGFGLWLVALRENAESIGICGLIKRDTLEDVDIGFALLPEYWNKGYAFEAAAGTMQYARDSLKISRVAAITSLDNESSGKLLVKLGFQFEKLIQPEPEEEKLKFFVSDR